MGQIQINTLRTKDLNFIVPYYYEKRLIQHSNSFLLSYFYFFLAVCEFHFPTEMARAVLKLRCTCTLLHILETSVNTGGYRQF